MLLTVFSFLLVFAIITLVHEGGHLIASKRAGIAVYEFGLGFGPTLYFHEYKGTLYKINLIPILGYVKIAGLDTEDPKEFTTPNHLKFYNKTLGQKFRSIFAGPMMNLITGFLIFSFLFALIGVPAGISNEIATISPGSEGAKVGLMVGDRLVAVDGKSYADPKEMINYIHNNAGKQISLSILRHQRQLVLKATPKYNKKMRVGLVGFSLKANHQKINPLQALYYGLKETISLSWLILLLLGRLFVGQVSLSDLAGPVGIAQITGQYAQGGALSLLGFIAFFSINVAVLNLLPLPALDGGRLFFMLIEVIRRKPIDIEVENKIHAVGLYVFLGLFVLLTANDLVRIFKP